MPSVDQLPVKELNEVDWEQLTEQQAAGFGLSLGLFNDAMEQLALARAAFLARASGTVVASLVGVIALTWTSGAAAVVGMVVALVVGTAGAWWGTRRARKAVGEAQQALLADIGQLPRG